VPGRLTAIPIPMKLRLPRGPIRHIVCVAVTQFALWASHPSAANLTLQISNDMTPPSGWAQVKVFVAVPSQVASGLILSTKSCGKEDST